MMKKMLFLTLLCASLANIKAMDTEKIENGLEKAKWGCQKLSGMPFYLTKELWCSQLGAGQEQFKLIANEYDNLSAEDKFATEKTAEEIAKMPQFRATMVPSFTCRFNAKKGKQICTANQEEFARFSRNASAVHLAVATNLNKCLSDEQNNVNTCFAKTLLLGNILQKRWLDEQIKLQNK